MGATRVLTTHTYVNVATQGQSFVIAVWGHQNVLWDVECLSSYLPFMFMAEFSRRSLMASPGREIAGG